MKPVLLKRRVALPLISSAYTEPAGALAEGAKTRDVAGVRTQTKSASVPCIWCAGREDLRKKGDGERSTRLSLLSPVVEEVEVPHSNGARVPVVSFALIAGRGDLADIGAVARRLVTAYLVGMDTQSSPESSSDVPPASASPAP